MPTDTTEKGLESLIMRYMTGTDGLFPDSVVDNAAAESLPPYGGTGWFAGHPQDYDREYAVDTRHLFAFLQATQPDEYAKLGISNYKDTHSMARQKFLSRLQGEITRRGVIDVLRHGIKHGPLSFDMFYGTPSPENDNAVVRHAANRFSITRQLRYSREETKRALDLCTFINGLPITTFELKNSLTKQTVKDAEEQYKQIRETIKGFAQVGGIIGAVKEGIGTSKTEQLAKYLRDGKKLIICTVQTFPEVLDRIGEEHRGKKFAIIIDEAHSNQGGRNAAAMSMALSENDVDAITTEDWINDAIEKRIKSRKLISNASYFAFTATPKNKTLEIFGIPYQAGDEVKHRPFHGYTMKQAIQEGFILDVLKYYTPVESYYRLAKTVEGDPEFDVKKARKKLRRYVESHGKAIRDKAEIMVDHFMEQVIGQNKIGGQARAMVVTGGIQRAIRYFFAFRDEHDKALKRVITALFTDDAQLFKQFQDNESFRHWLTDTIFGITYDEPRRQA
jgi:type I site-specific restriction-modification system R (restriction) subunit